MNLDTDEALAKWESRYVRKCYLTVVKKSNSKMFIKELKRAKNFCKNSDFRGNILPRRLEAALLKWQYSDTPYGKN